MESTDYHQIATKKIIAILSAAAAKIRNLEMTAHSLLYENGDQQGYYDQLRQKAILLSELPEKVRPPNELPPHLNALVLERVGGFSFDADRALRLDSVFYMSVLLDPIDYQKGAPNELEDLINHLML